MTSIGGVPQPPMRGSLPQDHDDAGCRSCSSALDALAAIPSSVDAPSLAGRVIPGGAAASTGRIASSHFGHGDLDSEPVGLQLSEEQIGKFKTLIKLVAGKTSKQEMFKETFPQVVDKFVAGKTSKLMFKATFPQVVEFYANPTQFLQTKTESHAKFLDQMKTMIAGVQKSDIFERLEEDDKVKIQGFAQTYKSLKDQMINKQAFKEGLSQIKERFGSQILETFLTKKISRVKVKYENGSKPFPLAKAIDACEKIENKEKNGETFETIQNQFGERIAQFYMQTLDDLGVAEGIISGEHVLDKGKAIESIEEQLSTYFEGEIQALKDGLISGDVPYDMDTIAERFPILNDAKLSSSPALHTRFKLLMHQVKVEQTAQGIIAESPVKGKVVSFDAVFRDRVVKKLGKGAYGTVFKIHKLGSDKFEAMKLPNSKECLDDLRNEARILSIIGGKPGIQMPMREVTISYQGQESTMSIGHLYSRGDLIDRINAGDMTKDEKLEMASQTSKGLAYIHAAGLCMVI